MRTVFLVSLICFQGCTGTSEQTADRAAPSTVSARTAGGVTRLEIQAGADRRHSLDLERDATVAPDAEPRVDVVGDIPGVALILVDTYPSLPGGMSYCQAGEERFLRVVSVARPRPAETYVVKVASCRDNIELADAGIEWRADRSTLRIHWLAGPAGTEEVRTLQIDSLGQARTIAGK